MSTNDDATTSGGDASAGAEGGLGVRTDPQSDNFTDADTGLGTGGADLSTATSGMTGGGDTDTYTDADTGLGTGGDDLGADGNAGTHIPIERA
ncbi:MAG: hypothetical protein M3Q29_03680 [Chloroflexota bacterium]|nr:hypothetical protein [Chloroflexota bacterium]